MSEDVKVAIVSGAARGIGRATAEQFAREGYATIGFDVAEPEGGAPDGWRFEICDVADEEQVAKLIAGVDAEYGRIDVLSNVAGIVLVKPIVETEWDEFRRLVDVNLGGIFLSIKHVVPIMERNGGGVIVNLGSVSGHVGSGRPFALRCDEGCRDCGRTGSRLGARAEEHPGGVRQSRLGGHRDAPRRHRDRGRPDRPVLRRGQEAPRGRTGARALGRPVGDCRGHLLPGRARRLPS